MKKVFSFLICSIILINLCGCKSNSEVEATVSDISFTAEADYGGKKLEYAVKIDSAGNTETEILKSGKPSGFKVLNDGVNTVFTLDGIEHKTSLSSLPEGIITDLFYICFKDAAGKPVQADENSFLVEGNTDKYNYKITLGETGLPLKLTESNLNISVIITNQSILKASD